MNKACASPISDRDIRRLNSFVMFVLENPSAARRILPRREMGQKAGSLWVKSRLQPLEATSFSTGKTG
jgi:hypothetical protein